MGNIKDKGLADAERYLDDIKKNKYGIAHLIGEDGYNTMACVFSSWVSIIADINERAQEYRNEDFDNYIPYRIIKKLSDGPKTTLMDKDICIKCKLHHIYIEWRMNEIDDSTFHEIFDLLLKINSRWKSIIKCALCSK